MKEERLKKQIEFIIEIDKLKNVFRKSYLSDSSRRENDAEHSWHISLMAFILIEYSNDINIDIIKVIKMLLIHDIVEIDAGDMFVCNKTAKDIQNKKEKEAADRLFSLLPPDQKIEMYSLWIEFEEQITPESIYAKSLDRLQPILLSYCSGGKNWKEEGVDSQEIFEVSKMIENGSNVLWELAQEIIKELSCDENA